MDRLCTMQRVLCLTPLIVGSALYAAFGHPLLPILEFEFARDATTAAEVVAGRTSQFRDALRWDWIAFIPGCLLTLLLCMQRLPDRGQVVVGSLLAGALALCDVIENIHLWRGLSNGQDTTYEWAALFAGIKLALLLPVLGLAGWGLFRRTRSA